MSDGFVAAPIDLDFRSASFKARSDRKILGLSQHAALRRITFDMSGSRRRCGLGPE